MRVLTPTAANVVRPAGTGSSTGASVAVDFGMAKAGIVSLPTASTPTASTSAVLTPKSKTYPSSLSRDPAKVPMSTPSKAPSSNAPSSSSSLTLVSSESGDKFSTQSTSPEKTTGTGMRDTNGNKVELLRDTLQSRAASSSSTSRVPSNNHSRPSHAARRDATPSSMSQPAILVSMLRGLSEMDFIKACCVPMSALERLKSIIDRRPPELMAGLTDAEFDQLKRTVAMYEFYWFTRDLDVDTLSTFVRTVTYDDIEDIAADEGGPETDEVDTTVDVDDEAGAEREGEASSSAALRSDNTEGDTSSQEADSGFSHVASPSVSADVVDAYCYPDDDRDTEGSEDEKPLGAASTPPRPDYIAGYSYGHDYGRDYNQGNDRDGCRTPPNEAKFDPRSAFLDPEARLVRSMGRRCASGAALLAASKAAARQGATPTDGNITQ